MHNAYTYITFISLNLCFFSLPPCLFIIQYSACIFTLWIFKVYSFHSISFVKFTRLCVIWLQFWLSNILFFNDIHPLSVDSSQLFQSICLWTEKTTTNKQTECNKNVLIRANDTVHLSALYFDGPECILT